MAINTKYCIAALGLATVLGIGIAYLAYRKKEDEEDENEKSKESDSCLKNDKRVNVKEKPQPIEAAVVDQVAEDVIVQSTSSHQQSVPQKPILKFDSREDEVTRSCSGDQTFCASRTTDEDLSGSEVVCSVNVAGGSDSSFDQVTDEMNQENDEADSTSDKTTTKCSTSVSYEVSVTGVSATDTPDTKGNSVSFLDSFVCDTSTSDSQSAPSLQADNRNKNNNAVEEHHENGGSNANEAPVDREHASEETNGISPMQVAETLMRLSKPGALSKLTLSDAMVLNYTVSFVQGKERARILETVAGAASFSVNLPLLTSSGCLASLQDFLKKSATDRRSYSENEKIALLHSLTNISCSDDNQQILKTSVDDLFSLSEGQEESRVGLACLCVVANLSLANHCHPEVSMYGTRLFELLEDEDKALLKQVLTILLNLCTEAATVPRLLASQAPSEMGTFVTRVGPIGKNTDLLIKWLRILRNLYKVMREEALTEEKMNELGHGDLDGTIYEALQEERLHMKACVFLLCHNKESHGLATSAKMLYEYLETKS